MTRRILGSVIILFSILFLPYWIYVPALFLAVVLFPFYWEGILFSFLIDIFYTSGIEAPYFISSFALIVLIILILLLPFRENLRLYV